MSCTLNLEILTTTNPKVMLVKDTSLFTPDDNIENFLLEIKPPGRDWYSKILVAPCFLESINCTHLATCCCGDFSDLGDGVYKIKLSYNPNLDTMVEFYHLRNVTQKGNYITAVCDLTKGKCNLTRREYLQFEEKLFKIRNIIEAAKWAVEECGDIDKGMSLYNQAEDLLSKFTNCQC